MPVFIAAALCIALVLVQDVLPANSWYHQGSYAGVLIATLVWQWWLVRRYWKYAVIVAGATIIGVAGLASALLAPDTQTVVRGPGESVPIADPAGVLQFPATRPPTPPLLRRPGRADVAIDVGGRRTYLAAYILWAQPRTAAYVEVTDPRGARLTITQPTNTSFLSPVLLFRATETIAGTDHDVDSFAVPATHRSVRAVLFTAKQIATMPRLASDPRPGILFAVADESGKLLPDGIGMARDGQTVTLGGVALRASIEPFPTVVIAAGPYLPLVALGLIVCLFGVFRVRSPSH